MCLESKLLGVKVELLVYPWTSNKSKMDYGCFTFILNAQFPSIRVSVIVFHHKKIAFIYCNISYFLIMSLRKFFVLMSRLVLVISRFGRVAKSNLILELIGQLLE